ncbi:MAG: DUF2490 domain-containing protein [Gemmatimonadaceae bacterium]
MRTSEQRALIWDRIVRTGVLSALLHALPSLPLAAQTGGWESVHQASTWLTVTVDEAVSKRAAFWFDGQWRRMGLGAEPQQLLLRPGVQWTLTPGARVGGGYAYIATAPYGEVPSATPLREHRLWQQLALSHRAGRVTFAHRYRWEQRWLAPVVGDETQAFQYQQRARYLVRAQSPLGSLTRGGQPIIGYIYDEMLLPVGHGTATGRLAQNRASVGVGVPIDARHRIEIGYLNLWNALTNAQTNEFNHTLTIGLVRTVAR